MTTAIDSNVLIALWDEGDALSMQARQALDAALRRGSLVISAPVYAELLAGQERTEEFLDSFCEATGIAVDWDLPEGVWRSAVRAFQSYASRSERRRNREPRRMLADFLIAAHAVVNGYRLLTLDDGLYRAGFPQLAVIRA